MKRNILSFGISIWISTFSFAQSVGDFAFIAFNADGDDDFAIVALSELPDTIFHFTDRDWNGNSFNTGEGTLFWDTEGIVPQGTVIVFTDIDSDENESFGSSVGSLTDTGGLNLAAGGDAIWAFVTNGTNDTTFISAIANEDDEFINIETTGLTLGTTAFDLSDGAGTPDGGIYSGLRYNSSFSNFPTVIYDFNNWTEDNTDGESLLPYNSNSFGLGSSVLIKGTAGWRMLSIPEAEATVSDISDDTAIQGITGGLNSEQVSNIYYNPASTGSGTNGWIAPTDIGTSWGDGLGSIVYFYDNTLGGSSELPIELIVTGSEPDSDVNITLSNKFTLVGNPFQSNIRLDDITANATKQGLYEGSLINGGLIGVINVYNNSTESYDTFNVGEGNIINAWQGFFIERNENITQVSVNANTLNIPTSAKTVSVSDVDIFSKSKADDWRRINLSLKTGVFQDNGTKLYFKIGSHEGRDSYDGSKLGSLNGSPTLAFVQNFGEGDVLLSQDARAYNLNTIQEYSLKINDEGVSGEYTLDWTTMKHIPADWKIVLNDYEAEQEIDMQVDTSYTFDIISKQKRKVSTSLILPKVQARVTKDSTNRFGITITPSTSVSNDEEIASVNSFKLEQNYPNPFNPSTTIKYAVGENGPVNITVYNVMGQKVAELLNTTKTAGNYQVTWNAAGVSSGIYYYRLTAPGQVLTRQMTLIK